MTRTTNARVAGSAFLLYIAVGVTQMVVSSGTGSADGVAARLALFAQNAARVRVNVVLSLVICVTALVLAETGRVRALRAESTRSGFGDRFPLP